MFVKANIYPIWHNTTLYSMQKATGYGIRQILFNMLYKRKKEGKVLESTVPEVGCLEPDQSFLKVLVV